MAKHQGDITFVLGAGISCPVLPLTRQLDDIVMTGEVGDGRIVSRGGDGAYHLEWPGTTAFDKWSPRIRSFLKWLERWLGGAEHGYEALYFACQQVADDLSREYENPILRPFVGLCQTRVERLLRQPEHADSGPADPRSPRQRLLQFMRETTNYIAGAVADALTSPSGVEAELAALHGGLVDACRDSAVGRINVVTLNHDVLLESSFAMAGLKPDDGFERWPGRGLDRWVGYKWRNAPKVRLVKLHGSIDWYVIRLRSGRDLLVRRNRTSSVADSDRRWDSLDARPRLLVGTTNKLLEYLRPFNIDRLAVFRRSLLRSDGLVVSGYSFRDKGVNSLITDWCWSRRRRLAVIGPDITIDPPGSARRAVVKAWRRLAAGRRLLPVRGAFADARWDDLRQFFGLRQVASPRSGAGREVLSSR